MVMAAEKTSKAMSIASLKIHMERAIGRIKNYQILDGALSNTLSSHDPQNLYSLGLHDKLPPSLAGKVGS